MMQTLTEHSPMRTLALTVWITVALFGFFGVVLFRVAPVGSEQLNEGYGVSYLTKPVLIKSAGSTSAGVAVTQ